MAILFGDTPGTLSDHRKGKHQDLVGTANEKDDRIVEGEVALLHRCRAHS